jgi:uncharacterized protein (DUF1015 family)
MVIVRPFRAYIPTPDKALQVAALPYDVMSVAEGKEIVKNNPISFLRVEKSSIDFPIGNDEHSLAVHQKAKQNLNDLIQQKILVKSNAPCLYLYQQVMGKFKQIGIVAAASIQEYEKKIIKKHELTREDKELDRTQHVETTNANTGAVFLTYRHQENIDNLVSKFSKEKPFLEFTAEDNITHSLWVVSNNDDITKINEAFKNVSCLYIADGHHRAAAAAGVYHARKEKNKNHTGNEPYNFFLSVLFPDNQVNVMDYNRALKTMNGLSRETLLEKLKEKFEVSLVVVSNPEEAKPKQRSFFTMYVEGVWYHLKTKPEFIPQNAPVKSLDVSILQNEILAPLFGIKNPRNDANIEFIGGIRGMRELVKRCNEDCKIGFALHPTGVDQLMQISDADEIMPPKSTWFEPKLRSGVIVRLLED